MAEAAVTFLLQQVTETLTRYKDLISGAEHELKQLSDELSLLKAILDDVASKSKKDRIYMVMERQIREVVYEVEDTLDTCLTEAAAAKGRRAVIRLLDIHRLKLAKQIKALREERVKPLVEKVKTDFLALGFAHGSGTSVEEPPMKMKKDQTIRQDRVVGFKDDEETIINYIKEPKEELGVISIIGMPGLGKTTLAWKIFQSMEICFEFPIRLWVYVSEKFNIRNVLLNILKKFTSQDMSSLSAHDLAQSVRVCLEKERFFLVLDDVWTVEAWDAIKEVLPASNGNAKVLITSRYNTIGMRANPSSCHHLRFLTQEESWELLRLEVFGDVEHCPQELESIGLHIARQCEGVPLTIVVIGGLLLDQFGRTEQMAFIREEWKKVAENVNLFLQNDKEQRISDVVALSYDRLPDDLRECFVYMGVFPDDHGIPVWTLTRLWIAEGFIKPKTGMSLEETAEENLDDLITRNLVVVDRTNSTGQVKVCRVQGMLRAFCKAKATEQSLFQEIKMSKHGEFEPPVSKIEEFSRLCLHSDVNRFLSERPRGQSVRSFLCFSKAAVAVDPKHISAIPDGFKLLRVIDSQSIKFHQFPGKLPKLIHLRYITLSVEGLTMLPEAISLLWNLQTLVVDTRSRSITIKANIWKMIRLRHLKTRAAIVLDPKWEGEGGENLQTLNRLSPESCTVAVSKRACNLKTLGIRGKLAALFKTIALENFRHLEKLKLVNDLLYGLASEDRLHVLPQWNCFPPNLRRLTLSNTFLDWKHMSTLAKIDTLEVLKLKDNAFSGISWSAVGGGFRSLQFLLIVNTDLVLWEASPDHFPSLRSLVLMNCENLKEIPQSLGKNLEKLEIERVRKSAVDSAKKIEAAKRQEQDQPKGKWGVRFKLVLGPGCEQY